MLLSGLAISFTACSSQEDKDQEVFHEIQRAVLDGETEVVRQAVASHPQLKTYPSPWDRSTLLHAACTNVQSEPMIRSLLQLGFDPNAKNDIGETPLDLAKRFNAKQKIRELLDKASQLKSQQSAPAH